MLTADRAISNPSAGMSEPPMPGRSGATTREALRELRHQGTPHSGRFGVAVQQDNRRTRACGEVMQLRALDRSRALGDLRAQRTVSLLLAMTISLSMSLSRISTASIMRGNPVVERRDDAARSAPCKSRRRSVDGWHGTRVLHRLC